VRLGGGIVCKGGLGRVVLAVGDDTVETLGKDEGESR